MSQVRLSLVKYTYKKLIYIHTIKKIKDLRWKKLSQEKLKFNSNEYEIWDEKNFFFKTEVANSLKWKKALLSYQQKMQ